MGHLAIAVKMKPDSVPLALAPIEPKRRNLAQTRARILESAADVFSRSGYRGAGLREIAVQADVAPSLVSKHFGGKAALFEETLLHILRTDSVFTWQKVGFGEAMAKLVEGRSNSRITAMLVLALGDVESREVAQRISREHMIQPLVAWLGPPAPLERAMAMFSLLTGFGIQMHGLYPEAIPERSLRWLAESLQAIVDADGVAP